MLGSSVALSAAGALEASAGETMRGTRRPGSVLEQVFAGGTPGC